MKPETQQLVHLQNRLDSVRPSTEIKRIAILPEGDIEVIDPGALHAFMFESFSRRSFALFDQAIETFGHPTTWKYEQHNEKLNDNTSLQVQVQKNQTRRENIDYFQVRLDRAFENGDHIHDRVTLTSPYKPYPTLLNHLEHSIKKITAPRLLHTIRNFPVWNNLNFQRIVTTKKEMIYTTKEFNDWSIYQSVSRGDMHHMLTVTFPGEETVLSYEQKSKDSTLTIPYNFADALALEQGFLTPSKSGTVEFTAGTTADNRVLFELSSFEAAPHTLDVKDVYKRISNGQFGIGDNG